MIDHTFLHCPGIGPKTEKRLKEMGYHSWADCLERPQNLPLGHLQRERFLKNLQQSLHALENHKIDYFVSRYPGREHWRILGTYYHQATFLDIETTGLSYYQNHTTVIAVYHQGKMQTFVYGENLDDFLGLLEETDLLVAFNGNSFDIPFLENSFNIPHIGCPYIDLRWISYHQGYTGGLKSIEKKMNIVRPPELADIDGLEAIDLFQRWQEGDFSARDRLLKYCQADVLATYLLASRLLEKKEVPVCHKASNMLFQSML